MQSRPVQTPRSIAAFLDFVVLCKTTLELRVAQVHCHDIHKLLTAHCTANLCTVLHCFAPYECCILCRLSGTTFLPHLCLVSMTLKPADHPSLQIYSTIFHPFLIVAPHFMESNIISLNKSFKCSNCPKVLPIQSYAQMCNFTLTKDTYSMAWQNLDILLFCTPRLF